MLVNTGDLGSGRFPQAWKPEESHRQEGMLLQGTTRLTTTIQ
jgi:hypothetical protein